VSDRLISADALKKELIKMFEPHADEPKTITLEDALVSTIMTVEEQPTAYDVDEKITQLRTAIAVEMKCATKRRANNGDQTNGFYKGIQRAIDIVKGGAE